MEVKIRSYGRMELAQAYFPQLTPRSAWKKFRFLMLDNDALSAFLSSSRRTFTPAQVQAVFTELGAP